MLLADAVSTQLEAQKPCVDACSDVVDRRRLMRRGRGGPPYRNDL